MHKNNSNVDSSPKSRLLSYVSLFQFLFDERRTNVKRMNPVQQRYQQVQVQVPKNGKPGMQININIFDKNMIAIIPDSPVGASFIVNIPLPLQQEEIKQHQKEEEKEKKKKKKKSNDKTAKMKKQEDRQEKQKEKQEHQTRTTLIRKIVCPENADPGDTLHIAENGQMFMVIVPSNVVPGQTFLTTLRL